MTKTYYDWRTQLTYEQLDGAMPFLQALASAHRLPDTYSAQYAEGCRCNSVHLNGQTLTKAIDEKKNLAEVIETLIDDSCDEAADFRRYNSEEIAAAKIALA